MSDVFLSAGVRTPFVKAGGVYARHSALELSIPVVQRMCARGAAGSTCLGTGDSGPHRVQHRPRVGL